ncbi:phospholipase A [Aidingimonas lacisalsi]|uniref:phospholipase A n=1 Tax=Aidingimonas lacisalsi TaxID=2604086 RepID=UPI0011D2BD43|nr:phospholipase A [Aidingimonas lacisalsi]
MATVKPLFTFSLGLIISLTACFPALAQQSDEVDEAVQEANQRRFLEEQSERNPFSITTYRRNYLMLWSYNTNPNDTQFRAANDGVDADHAEVMFQFSAKFSMADDIFGENGDLYFAYTQRSWWQAYNSEASSPFRETNFEPEFFISFENDWQWLGWTNTQNRIAINHQSNGQSGDESRSWNRVYLDSVFQRGKWSVSVAPHWRVPESRSNDDNPDIEKYMGYGDVTVARRLNDDHEASLMVRGNPGAGNMGAQLDYSWPLFGNVRGHIQYYNGYGESLIDYDNRNHRLSLGFSLNPLFSGSSIAR